MFCHISYIWVLCYHLYYDSLLGLSYLVVSTDKFFALLKQKMATERLFEVWGEFPRFGEGGGTVKKNCLARPSEKMSQMHALENFWCDLG